MTNETLPKGWEWTTLGDVARWGSGGTPKRTNASYYEGGAIPWAIIGDLKDGPVTSIAGRITHDGLTMSSAKWVEPGSILMAMYGSIGKLGIATERMTCNQAIAFATPRNDVHPKYLFWYLRSIRDQLKGLGKGGTQQNIGQGVIKAVPFPLAPGDVQFSIVEEIEKQFTRLDAAVGALQRTRANLTGFKRVSIARRFQSSAPPVSLGSLIRHLTSGSRGWAKYYREEGALFLRVGNLNHLTVALDLTRVQLVAPPQGPEHVRTKVQPGDVLISITAELGMVAVAPSSVGDAFINQHLALVRLADDVNPAYVGWYLAGPGRQQLLKLQRGATKAGLGLDDIRAVEVPLPLPEDQASVVAEIESDLSVISVLEHEIDNSARRAGRIRQSILAKAFSGRQGATSVSWSLGGR